MKYSETEQIITKQQYEQELKNYLYIAAGYENTGRKYKRDFENAIVTISKKLLVSLEDAEDKISYLCYDYRKVVSEFNTSGIAPADVMIDYDNYFLGIYIYLK